MTEDLTRQLARLALSARPELLAAGGAQDAPVVDGLAECRALVAAALPDPADRATAGTVAARVLSAIGAGLGRGGWDAVAIAAGLGVTAALGRAAGLDHGGLARAMSIVATQSTARHPDRVSATARDHQRALATANAAEAVALAAAGFSAPETGLGGRRGLIAVMIPGACPR
jgi:2-methylcitrate dehydratase PrpD